MTLNEALAMMINELLQEKGMTQYRLAMNSGVPAQCISDIRKQRNRTNALNIVYEIAHGFEMSLAQFFDSSLFAPENIIN